MVISNEVKRIEVVNENNGVRIYVTPITLTFANQVLISLGISKCHTSFGIDCFSVGMAPGEELGRLCISLDDGSPTILVALYNFLGVTKPLGKAL